MNSSKSLLPKRPNLRAKNPQRRLTLSLRLKRSISLTSPMTRMKKRLPPRKILNISWRTTMTPAKSFSRDNSSRPSQEPLLSSLPLVVMIFPLCP